MADKNEQEGLSPESADSGTSVFDLFEPPPERDPNSFGKIPVIKEDEIDLTDSSAEVKAAADAEAAGLQHWTAPPTGQVPAVLSGGSGDKTGLWGDVTGPSWHGDDPSWDGPDLADVFADTESVSIESDVIDLDDDDDGDGFDSVAVQRPSRAASSKRPTADVDRRPDGAETGPSGAPRTGPAAPPVRRDSAPATPEQPRPGSADNATGRAGHRPPAPVDRQAKPLPNRPNPAEPSPAGNVSAPPPQRSGGETPADGAPVRRTEVPPPQARQVPAAGAGSAAAAGLARPTARTGEPNIDDIRFADTDSGISRPERPAGRATGLLGGTDAEERVTGRPPARERIHEDPDVDDDPSDAGYSDEELGLGPVGGRNLPQAIGVGFALAAVVVTAMFFGPYPTMLLIVVLALLAVLELYNAMRLAGLRPATLLGIVGTVAAPAAAYYRGDAAFPLVVALTVVFGVLWYLVGADTERPVLNLSLTMMGIFWIGGLAAFAALMVRQDLGMELLLATIIITVVSDTMAYIGGRAYGSRPFHHASPNKTWEGTITGLIGSVFAGFAIGVTEMGSIWDGKLVPAIVLGAVVGCLAPMGDLAESVVKRDLGVKDMGTLLPGHGGVLDRIDGLLFALPGAYYLALVYGLF